MIPTPDLPEEKRNHSELDTLNAMLDYYRTVLVRKCASLDAEQLATRLGPSTLTLGGLLKHMALVEDNWFRMHLLGEGEIEPWASVDWTVTPDWEFDTAKDDSPEHLLELFTSAVEASRRNVAATNDLDFVIHKPSPEKPSINLRWVLVHMIEEYARHCGHADLIRESIDGQVDD